LTQKFIELRVKSSWVHPSVKVPTRSATLSKRWASVARNRLAPWNFTPPQTLRGSGAVRGGTPKPAIYSLASTTGSPRASTTRPERGQSIARGAGVAGCSLTFAQGTDRPGNQPLGQILDAVKELASTTTQWSFSAATTRAAEQSCKPGPRSNAPWRGNLLNTPFEGSIEGACDNPVAGCGPSRRRGE
jgi:hypothetical protein